MRSSDHCDTVTMSKDSSDQPDESKWPKSVTDPIPRGELPKKLQKIADEQDDWMDEIYDGAGPDTTETQLRYAAYARRLKTVMLSAQRYVAYTSDIGESFRPVAHPYWIRTAYGISWAYLVGDVAHEGYKAFRRNEQLASPGANQHFDATAKDMPATRALPSSGPMHIPAIEDYRSVMAQRALFQSVASMGLPAFTIHSVVKYSGRAFRNAANTTVRTWAPIGVSHDARHYLATTNIIL